MEKTIKLYNPADFPFGSLSNNAEYSMIIDKKRWNTVTNYILSNMLTTPTYRLIMQIASIQGEQRKTNIDDKIRQIVANIEVRTKKKVIPSELEDIKNIVLQEVDLQGKNIQQLYKHYLDLEYVNTIRSAVDRAYAAKIAGNSVLGQILVSTGNSPIVYDDADNILGSGLDGSGQNLVGITLMQLRHNSRVQIELERKDAVLAAKENSIFTAYKALIILRNEKDNLQEYYKKPAGKIVKIYLKKHPGEILTVENLKSTIVEMFNRGQFPIIEKELEQPGSMAENMGKPVSTPTFSAPEIIFKTYLAFVIDEKFPLLTKAQKKAAILQFPEQAISRDTLGDPIIQTENSYTNLVKQIVDLFEAKSLPEKLMVRIEKNLNSYQAEEKSEDEAEIEVSENSQEEDTESLDDNDPLKFLLSDEGRREKSVLIDKLVLHSGKAKDKYKKWSVERLKRHLEKYDEKNTEDTDEAWNIEYKQRSRNKIVTLKTVYGNKPSKDDTEHILKKYNRKNGTDIRLSEVFVRKQADIRPKNIEQIPQDAPENLPQENVSGYIKELGPAVRIYSDPKRNEENLREFSPLYKKIFDVDGFSYPSVSLYITTMLYTQTGVSIDIGRKEVYTKGTSIRVARQALMKSNVSKFVSPDTAIDIYTKLYDSTQVELTETFAKIAMNRKFEDPNMQNLLLLTGPARLIWADTNDPVLGYPGKNQAGVILMDLRTEIEKKHIQSPLVVFPDSIGKIVVADSFINSWIQMRIADMCTAVSKVKLYLKIIGNQEEEIDARFVSHVLDNFFQPCNALVATSKKVTIPAPTFFIKIVENCKDMPVKQTKNYNAEITKLQNEMYRISFGEGWAESKDEQVNLRKFISEQNDRLKSYMSTGPPPSEGDLENFRAEQKKQLDTFLEPRKEKETFEQKQKRQWHNFLAEITKSKFSDEEIDEKMRAFEAKEGIRTTPAVYTIEDIKKDEEYRKKRKRVWNSLHVYELSVEEIKEKIDIFDARQAEERKKYYKKIVKSTEQQVQEDEMIDEIRSKITVLARKQKDELSHHELIVRDIAQIYWNRIVAMLYFLIEYIGETRSAAKLRWDEVPGVAERQEGRQPTEHDIRNAIVSAELLNSDQAPCEGIIDLADPEDKCIASALSNLLVGLQSFKHQYAEDISLGKYDVDLSVSIILNRPYKPEEKAQGLVEPELQEKIGSSISQPEDNLVENETVPGSKLSEEGSTNMSLEDELNDAENSQAEFSMGRKKKDFSDQREAVKIALREISRKYIENIDDVAEYFLKAVADIKESNISSRLKQNRINFFSSVRN